jgi:hypothetical protein
MITGIRESDHLVPSATGQQSMVLKDCVIQTSVQKRNVLPGYDGRRSRSYVVSLNADWYKMVPRVHTD